MDKICAAIPQIAEKRCSDIADQAQAVANKYGTALLLFSKCHNMLNSSNKFEDSDISALSKIQSKISH